MESQQPTLVPLGDSDRTIADPAADVRGRHLLDANNDEIGKVDDLLVDEDEMRVRFLRAKAGGFLGIGRTHFLIPVDAVAEVDDDAVHIDKDRASLEDVPPYDPDVVREAQDYADIYDWWGFGPYWVPGYVAPAFPSAHLYGRP